MTKERSPNLQQALERFRTMRQLMRQQRYETAIDEALADLVEAVADELVRQQSAIPAITTPVDVVSQHNVLPQNKLLRQPPIVSPPRVMRPMSHWVEHMPDYGDGSQDRDRALYETKRRVHPDDIELAEDELERIHAPKLRSWEGGPRPEVYWVLFCTVMIVSVLGFLVWYL